MPTEQEFDAAIEGIKAKLGRIGDHVVDELATPEDATAGTKIIHCRHGELTFVVVAEPDREFFELVYPLNLVASLASQVQDEPELHKYFERDGHDVNSEQEAMGIAEELLDSIPPPEKHRLLFHLVERLSSPVTSFRTEGTGTGGLARFECKKKIFPYEDPFSLAQLSDAVQAVISVGHRATQFLYSTLVLDVSDKGEKPTVQLRFRLPDEVNPPGSPELKQVR